MIGVGVDAGGSHTEAVAVDGTGTEVGRGTAGPGWAGDLDAAESHIREAVGTTGAKADGLVVGAAGAGDPEVARRLGERLSDLAPIVRVTTDLEIALAAAFPRGPGIILIAGTGSVAAGRDEGGAVRRSGGRGPKAGDEGSAYWLGNQALMAGLVTGMGVDRATIAALAPQVCRLAEMGNAQAIALIEEAADHLAALIPPLALPPDTPIVLHGGLFRHGPALATAVTRRLKHARAESLDPARTAALLALQR